LAAIAQTIKIAYSAASVIGFLIAVARLCGREQKFRGEHLWGRGYAVSTVRFELEFRHFAGAARLGVRRLDAAFTQSRAGLPGGEWPRSR
jgi:hypothetical protein